MSNYTKALFDLMGWQGGTIHQISKELDIIPEDLIYGRLSANHICTGDCDFMKGQYAHDSCSKEWTRDKLVPMYKGNLEFWLGYMRAAYLASL